MFLWMSANISCVFFCGSVKVGTSARGQVIKTCPGPDYTGVRVLMKFPHAMHSTTINMTARDHLDILQGKYLPCFNASYRGWSGRKGVIYVNIPLYLRLHR